MHCLHAQEMASAFCISVLCVCVCVPPLPSQPRSTEDVAGRAGRHGAEDATGEGGTRGADETGMALPEPNAAIQMHACSWIHQILHAKM